jgi:GAF domain-containing protein
LTRHDQTERRLLQSVATVARHVFGAAAASVFLVDPQTRELVFEAVSGEGDQQLLGSRFPPQTGIAGMVAASGQSMIIDDLREAAAFSREAAASTGYVPSGILAAPLFSDERCIGVLEVLDRAVAGARETADLELLELLADQAALGLEMLLHLRGSRDEEQTDIAARLLAAAEAVLANRNG